ncbi:MAG: HIT family protein [Chlamydiia bacterium]|nr:HIT family protein [Chlamydiia bacterium]
MIKLSLLTAAVPAPVLHDHPCDFHRGEAVKITTPLTPLSGDSVSVISTNNRQRFKQWKAAEHEESFYALRSVAACWQQRGYAQDYLILGKTSPGLKSERFSWEAVPYPAGGWSDLKQISVMWKVAFGVDPISEEERIHLADQNRTRFQKPIPHLTEAHPAETASDPFCDPEVLAKQTIYRGKKVSLLYDHSPMRLGGEMPHFLVITNAHKTHFEELSPDEYIEAMQVANAVASYFQEAQPKSTLYFLHKKGRPAGQTVPHWHMHIIVKEDDASIASFQFPCLKSPTSCTSLSSPFLLIRNKLRQCGQSCLSFASLLWPNERLSDEELAERVAFYKKELDTLPPIH